MCLKEVFKLNKNVILIDLLISIFMIIILILNPNFLYRLVLFNKSVYWQAGWFLINFIVLGLVYYPLSCGLMFIYGKLFRKKKKTKVSSLILAVLIVLLLNPVTLSLVYNYILVEKNNCSLIISGFTENSPAQNAGMKVGEIVEKIDDYEVNNLDSLTHSLANKRAGDSVLLKTDLNQYEIITIGEPNSQRAVLGVKLGEFCSL